MMAPDDALAFVEAHGVVLLSGKGPVPQLVEAIAGEPIKGSWWGHPGSHEIFRIINAVTDCPDVLVCRVVDGKVTLAHRRLWPALIRAATCFPTDRLARTDQEHTASGRHVRRDTPFPDWADADSLRAAKSLTLDDALHALGEWTKGLRPGAGGSEGR